MDRWETLEALFDEASQIADEAERRRFVEDRSDLDADLRSALMVLLENDSQENCFLDEPAYTLGATVLAGSLEEEINTEREFAHYRLLELLGRGGMGVVYLAHDTLLHRRAALKILPGKLSAQGDMTARFRQEARAASKVNHPSVAHIYEFGEFEGRHFISMEYVRGRTLRRLMSDGPLQPEIALDIVQQIASALQAAHAVGIIHRDIKPENVVVTDGGLVKVLDFGLAKLTPGGSQIFADTSLETQPGLLMGTAAYMSPEQVRGQAIDKTTDVWSLGVVLYEILAGRRPFNGETPSDIRAAVLRDEPPRIPGDIGRIIERALRKNPSGRYQSVDELSAELAALKTTGGDDADLRTEGTRSKFDTDPARVSDTETEMHTTEPAKTSGLISGLSSGWVGFAIAVLLVVVSVGVSLVTFRSGGAANVAAARSDAKREYETGLYIWNKRKVEEMPQALAHFQKAIEIDPGFAPAYAGLANAYGWDGNPALSEDEKRAVMRAALQRAIALDPNLAEAHTTYASLLSREWNWTEAVNEYERAIQADPNYATAHQWYAEMLAFIGEDEKAVVHINRALELDPLSFAILNDSVTVNWYTRNYRDAIKNAERITTFDSRYASRTHVWLSRLYAHIGDTSRARIEFDRYVQLEGNVSDGDFGDFYALIGDRDVALPYLKRVENSKDAIRDAWTLAGIYSDLGMTDDAFKWLYIALENRNPSIAAIAANPDFDHLRSDPRFMDLLRKLNLAEYWKSRLNQPNK